MLASCGSRTCWSATKPDPSTLRAAVSARLPEPLGVSSPAVVATFSALDLLVLPILRWTIVTPLALEDASLRLAGLVSSDDDLRDDPHRPLRGSVSFGSVRLRRATRWGAPIYSYPDTPSDFARYPPWYFVAGSLSEHENRTRLELWVFPAASSALALLGTLVLFGTFAYAAAAIAQSDWYYTAPPLAAHLFFQWKLRQSLNDVKRKLRHAFGA